MARDRARSTKVLAAAALAAVLGLAAAPRPLAAGEPREPTWSERASFEHAGFEKYVTCLALSPDGSSVAIGGDHRGIWVGSLATGRLFHRVSDGASAVAFTASGLLVEATSRDLRLRSLPDLDVVRAVNVPALSMPRVLAPTSSRVALRGKDARSPCEVWELDHWDLGLETPRKVGTFPFSPSTSNVWIAGDGEVLVTLTETRALFRGIKGESVAQVVSAKELEVSAVSRSGQLAALGYGGDHVVLVDRARGQLRGGPVLDAPPLPVAFDVLDEKKQPHLDTRARIEALAFSPDERFLAVGAMKARYEPREIDDVMLCCVTRAPGVGKVSWVEIWDLAAKTRVARIRCGEPIKALAFSPSSDSLAVADVGGVRVFGRD